MRFPSKEIVEQLREQYPEGTRVELISMSDQYSHLPSGARGTVRHVDDAGTVFVGWDCGSGLGVIYGVDSVRIVNEEG